MSENSSEDPILSPQHQRQSFSFVLYSNYSTLPFCLTSHHITSSGRIPTDTAVSRVEQDDDGDVLVVGGSDTMEIGKDRG